VRPLRCHARSSDPGPEGAGAAPAAQPGEKRCGSASGSSNVSPGRIEISLKVFGYGAARAEDFVFGT
jgi:hypothetical protein